MQLMFVSLQLQLVFFMLLMLLLAVLILLLLLFLLLLWMEDLEDVMRWIRKMGGLGDRAATGRLTENGGRCLVLTETLHHCRSPEGAHILGDLLDLARILVHLRTFLRRSGHGI